LRILLSVPSFCPLQVHTLQRVEEQPTRTEDTTRSRWLDIRHLAHDSHVRIKIESASVHFNGHFFSPKAWLRRPRSWLWIPGIQRKSTRGQG